MMRDSSSLGKILLDDVSEAYAAGWWQSSLVSLRSQVNSLANHIRFQGKL